tara:strand:+ start:2134 stop:3018 length:885 start_codon:yes stop_codon:yes gene_type:complete
MPINILPSADYYSNEDLHGNYQYVTLEDMVNNFMMSGDEDDYTSHVDRYKVLFQTRRAFRELYFDIMREIKAIELELSPTLNVVLPPDFVNYVRISWVDETGQLHPMAIDESLSIAKVYLQDNNYEILFDDNGCVLQSSNGGLDLNPETGEASVQSANKYGICRNSAFQPNKNFANDYPNGKYNIDKNNGLIQFGSEVFGKHIVLEYISDGLYTGCEGMPEEELRIHKFAETAVYDWVYWKLVERRRNVPANEKGRARKEWFNSRRITGRRIKTIRASELRQTFKGSNKWIKGV